MVKGLNPADQFRKEQKKKEIKKSKKEQEELSKVRELLNDSSKIEAEIVKLEIQSQENRLDKGIKDKIKELKAMKVIALKKEQIREQTSRLRHPSLQSDSDKEIIEKEPVQNVREPSESIYYHPVYNPLAVPPLGQQQVYKPKPVSSIPFVPLPPKAVPVHRSVVTSSHPSYQNIVFGGQNGIPLPPPPPRPPPPRPMVPNYQSLSPNAPNLPIKAYMQQMGSVDTSELSVASSSSGPSYPVILQLPRGSQPLKKMIDPLDPSDSHYTERFSASFLKNDNKNDNSYTQDTVDNKSETEEQLLIEKRLQNILQSTGGNRPETSENVNYSTQSNLSIQSTAKVISTEKLAVESLDHSIVESSKIDNDSKTSGVGKVLKVIKPSHGLTAFIPSSLQRGKRKNEELPKPSKISKISSEANEVSPVNKNEVSSQMNNSGISIFVSIILNYFSFVMIGSLENTHSPIIHNKGIAESKTNQGDSVLSMAEIIMRRRRMVEETIDTLVEPVPSLPTSFVDPASVYSLQSTDAVSNVIPVESTINRSSDNVISSLQGYYDDDDDDDE
jgi:hypothetical protein